MSSCPTVSRISFLFPFLFQVSRAGVDSLVTFDELLLSANGFPLNESVGLICQEVIVLQVTRQTRVKGSRLEVGCVVRIGMTE